MRCKSLLLLGCLALGTVAQAKDSASSTVFVGSSTALQEIQPGPYTRLGLQGQVEFKDSVVLGFADYRLALFYTRNRNHPEIQVANNLHDSYSEKPVPYYLTGGANQEVDRLVKEGKSIVYWKP